MKKIMSVIPLFMGLSAFAQTGQTFIYETLSRTRENVKFPELTTEEKLLVVDQAKLVMKEVFVHRDLKIKNFGSSADILPALEEIGKRAGAISTDEFHKEMFTAFQRVHDWHTTYRLPHPYSCYRTIIPVSFRAVKDEFGNEVIAVDTVSDKPELLRLMPPDVKFNVGDVLVKYNGYNAADAVIARAPLSFGANPAAVKRDSVNLLSLISQKYVAFPNENNVTLTLKDKTGNLKTFTVPWITRTTKECLNPTPAETGFKGDKDFQRDFNQIFKRKARSKLKGPGDLLDSKEPILKYKMIRNEFGSFSYIRLDSFVPEKLSVNETVLEVKRLLEGPLADGEGLIIDLRDNGGGQILLGEAIVQLLNPKATVPLNFSLMNSTANHHLFKSANIDQRFVKALDFAVREGLAYTVPQPLNSVNKVNNLGQSFMKPVALFINASCYSTCDMISASVQDLGAGIIVGEDPNTGAGGANNWYHSSIIKILPEDNRGPFKQLPGEIEIGFSFRQTSRTGSHAGELIEDVGVKADMLVPATVADLGTGNEQLRLITKKLAEETANYRSSVKMMNKESFDVQIGEIPKLLLKWNEMTSLEIDGSATIDLEASNTEGREVSFPDDFRAYFPETKTYEVTGKLHDKVVWRKILTVRSVAAPVELSRDRPVVQGLDLDHKPFIIYNNGNGTEDGWQLKNGQLRIGDGSASYRSYLDTQAILFANVKDATSLTFKASVDSEEKFDFFKVSYIVDGVETVVQNLSGNHEMKTYEIPLTSLQGKNVEFRFTFTSDGNTEADGPRIEEILIK